MEEGSPRSQRKKVGQHILQREFCVEMKKRAVCISHLLPCKK